jgi:hypothetical protein
LITELKLKVGKNFKADSSIGKHWTSKVSVSALNQSKVEKI